MQQSRFFSNVFEAHCLISIGFADHEQCPVVGPWFCLSAWCFAFASGFVVAPLNSMFILDDVITGVSAYGLRTLYFAAVKEGHIPIL